jgi:hypothetical protein
MGAIGSVSMLVRPIHGGLPNVTYAGDSERRKKRFKPQDNRAWIACQKRRRQTNSAAQQHRLIAALQNYPLKLIFDFFKKSAGW